MICKMSDQVDEASVCLLSVQEELHTMHNKNKLKSWSKNWWLHIESLVPDSSNSIANTLELLQSCSKPSLYFYWPDDWKYVMKSHGYSSINMSTVTLLLSPWFKVSCKCTPDTYMTSLMEFVWEPQQKYTSWFLRILLPSLPSDNTGVILGLCQANERRLTL